MKLLSRVGLVVAWLLTGSLVTTTVLFPTAAVADEGDEGGYDEGSYDEGGYDEGGYDEGGYDEGGYDEGGYDEGSGGEE
ncbi:MAG: hypothetical protein ACOX6T_07260 [Myxococcales bacterium]|jgi:uncharacterized membrane protein